MSSFLRSTRECTVSQLNPQLQRAVRDYFNTHNLGEPGSEALLCCETVSQKKPGNWLSDWIDGSTDSMIYTAVILTARSLVWARSGDRSAAHIVGADLMNIHARLNVSMFSKNFGLEVNGRVEDSKSNLRGVIGLGPDPAAEKFCNDVCQAIEKINPTPKRVWPSWMGGR